MAFVTYILVVGIELGVQSRCDRGAAHWLAAAVVAARLTGGSPPRAALWDQVLAGAAWHRNDNGARVAGYRERRSSIGLLSFQRQHCGRLARDDRLLRLQIRRVGLPSRRRLPRDGARLLRRSQLTDCAAACNCTRQRCCGDRGASLYEVGVGLSNGPTGRQHDDRVLLCTDHQHTGRARHPRRCFRHRASAPHLCHHGRRPVPRRHIVHFGEGVVHPYGSAALRCSAIKRAR